MRAEVLALLITFAGLSACYKSRLPAGTCENDQLSELLSTDKQWKSVLFQRQCGDEASEMDVSVLPATAALPNLPGNVFRQDAIEERPRSPHSLHQTWTGPHELWIRRDHGMKVAFAASEVGPVRVTHSVGESREP